MQIVIPFAQIDTINPNLQDANYHNNIIKYFKCIAVACHSFRQNNTNLKIKVVTNSNIIQQFEAILSSLNVEIIYTEYSFEPTIEFGKTFRGCFFFFDALKELTDNSLIIDPDLICVQNISDMEVFLSNKVAVFKPEFGKDRMINGLTPQQANEIYDYFSGSSSGEDIEHIGGEAIYVPVGLATELLNKASILWDWNVVQAKNGKPFLTTEEHMLTVLLRDTNCDSLSPYLSRIWTAKSYREIEGKIKDINKLMLWHLPSEKNHGFQKIFNKIFEPKFDYLNYFPNRTFYASQMNLQSNFFKKCKYSVYRSLRKLKKF